MRDTNEEIERTRKVMDWGFNAVFGGALAIILIVICLTAGLIVMFMPVIVALRDTLLRVLGG